MARTHARGRAVVQAGGHQRGGLARLPSLQLETVAQRVVVIDEERMLASDRRCGFDFSDERGVLTHLRPAGDAATMQCADEIGRASCRERV